MKKPPLHPVPVGIEDWRILCGGTRLWSRGGLLSSRILEEELDRDQMYGLVQYHDALERYGEGPHLYLRGIIKDDEELPKNWIVI